VNREEAFDFDGSLCSGCRACVVACLDQNDLPPDSGGFRRVLATESGPPDRVRLEFVSQACDHCLDPPCLPACPSGAIHREEGTGLILIQRESCVGCHNCALACPFGAPLLLADGRMAKCDLCRQRLEEGLEPACVRVCPTGALRLNPVGGTVREKQERTARRVRAAGLDQSRGRA